MLTIQIIEALGHQPAVHDLIWKIGYTFSIYYHKDSLRSTR